MMRTSVLESMSGPMCDSVLGRKSSARVLEALEAANALVIPLDRSRSWYRYHPMLRDLLRAEQCRRDPEGVVEVVRRAAVWCEANGEAEAAVGYAQLAGDVDRVAALAVKHWLTVYQAGHAATVESWLDWLLDHDSRTRPPPGGGVGRMGIRIPRSAHGSRTMAGCRGDVVKGIDRPAHPPPAQCRALSPGGGSDAEPMPNSGCERSRPAVHGSRRRLCCSPLRSFSPASPNKPTSSLPTQPTKVVDEALSTRWC